MDSADGNVCSFSGALYLSEGSPEALLLQVIFGIDKYTDMRNWVFRALNIPRGSDFPWDKHILYIEDMTIGDDDKDDEAISAFARSIAREVHAAFAYDPSLVIFALPLTDSALDRKTAILTGCGYAKIADTDELYDDCRFLYAYTP